VQILLLSGILAFGLSQSDATEDELFLELRDGQLTIRAEDEPAELLLAELGRVAGVTFRGAEELGNDLISIELTDVGLEPALREILEEWDAFFFYGSGGGEPSRLQAVWVYPSGRGQGLAPVATEEWENLDDLGRKLADREPYVRLRALEILAKRGDDESHRMVLDAMRTEADDAIRMKMVTAVLGSSLEVPPDLWKTFATIDRSEDIRAFALLQLEDHPDFRNVASAALTDPSPGVRGLAEMLIEELDAQEFEVPTGQVPVQQE